MESWFYLLRLANHMQKLQIYHGDSTLLRLVNLIENLGIHHREWTLFITFGKPHTKPPDTSRRVDS